MKKIFATDYIVIGSGLAGSVAAYLLGEIGEVYLLSKESPDKSNSFAAQGGIAAAIGNTDSPLLHAEDTVKAGHGLCQPLAVEAITEKAPQLIEWLVAMGVPFDRNQQGQLTLGMEGAHSRNRILHAGGDNTGQKIMETMIAQLPKCTNVKRIVNERAVALVKNTDGRVIGVITHSDTAPSEDVIYYGSKGVILATGGSGQLYSRTTNPLGATGDGIALAYLAGAKIRNLEFVQFHPTALDQDHTFRFLISEAVRGAGGTLVTATGKAVMKGHPQGDLAPRDVVARAIYSHAMRGEEVYLDCRNIDNFKDHFPTIYEHCLAEQIDPLTQPIPVAPAAHFLMGGIVTNLNGETSVPGLYALGEVASTGLHGANRLASNSLLECIAMGFALTEHKLESTGRPAGYQTALDWASIPRLKPDPEPLLQKIQKIMWEHAGIVRHQEGLSKGIHQLEQLSTGHPDSPALLVARLIMESALARQESRGAHYRSDFPAANPALAQTDTMISMATRSPQVLTHV